MNATDKVEWARAKAMIAEGRKMKQRIFRRICDRARRDKERSK